MSSQSIHLGPFIKDCPCSPSTIACGYYNINLHTGCPYDCSYCILQLYLPSKTSLFFSNFTDSARELRLLAQYRTELRIGTGELADSLADPQSDDLMPFFFSLMAELPKTVLELKTKSNRVTALLKQPFQPNIVVGWSLNPHEIISREEKHTATLDQRLKAMKAVTDKGYKTAIHFDPIILTPGWQVLYQELVEQIFAVLSPEQIAWWSLGALRFPAGLRTHIFRHHDSRLFEGELVKGYDDKYRYLRPLREELFQTLRSIIQARLGTNEPLYLCMEDEAMWRRIFPEHEPMPEAINRRLYNRVLT